MTKILVDALIALTKLTDRGLTAIESVRLRTLPQSVAGAQPAGAGDSPVSAPGTGGHPDNDIWLADIVGPAGVRRRGTTGAGRARVANTAAVRRSVRRRMRERARELVSQGD